MRLFDLHCDTATRLLAEKQEIYDNPFHISLKKAEYIENYAQVMAIWTEHKLTDAEGYARFFEVADNLKKEISKNHSRAAISQNFGDIRNTIDAHKVAMILAVEDARIVENDLSRLDVLYTHGVRLLTLNWYGETCIGGAHNTDVGLSDFGIQVVKRCFDVGIIPDVSHSSFEGTKMVLQLANEASKPIVATHSDSYTVNPHKRNLKDEDFIAISRLSGLVGINLCPSHLSSKDHADINDIMKHIEHYLSLGGENTVAMGGDLDGADLPIGFSGIADIYKIADEMQRLNYSTELTEKIMYKNAFGFFKNNL